MHESPADPNALAALARLALSESETKQFGAQLPSILEYVSQLQSVAIEGIASLPRPPAAWRPDQAGTSRVIEQILAEAPERQDHFWKVKAVFA